MLCFTAKNIIFIKNSEVKNHFAEKLLFYYLFFLLNDAFLGFSIIALGLIVWIIILLIKDPNSVIRDALFSKKNK